MPHASDKMSWYDVIDGRASLPELRAINSRLGGVRYFMLAQITLLCLASEPSDLAGLQKQVVEVFEKHCFKCHGATKVRGGLSLVSKQALAIGGDTGPVINPKNPDQSVLWKAIEFDGLEMPPSGKLPDRERQIIKSWISAGAPLPEGKAVAKTAEHPKPKLEDAKTYWAYQPVKAVPVPVVKQPKQPANPIDAFLLAKLGANGLAMNPRADKRTLIRRATYDLTGLPPTPEAVQAFMADSSPDSYSKLIDKLLASSAYGERWGRHWLDVVRYAETNGYERDGAKPNVHRYRDYVIRSFNADKPYDRFVKEQLAGDEIDPDEPDALMATGFYRLGVWDDEPADRLQATFDEFDDIVATTSQAFLGMTMNCARCHDHKIDPIPQTDYYRLLAFFRDIPRFSNDRNVMSSTSQRDVTPKEKRKVYEKELEERDRKKDAVAKKIVALEDVIIKRMPPEDQRASEGLDRPQVVGKLKNFWTPGENKQLRDLRQERDKLERMPTPSQELALALNKCDPKPPETHLLVRGNPHAQGPLVKPGFPVALGGPEPSIVDAGPQDKSAGRRKVLANWVASPENPLTARVWMNRVWQHHMGRGIVTSSNDFGKFGTPPTHPELLDWMAGELVRQGWHTKPIHKLIMLSDAYTMSSAANQQALAKDPNNHLYWRYPMRRLEAEEVRDSILQVTGQLSREMYGPQVYPPIAKEVLAGQSRPGEGWPVSSPEQANRRSVYVHVKRSLQLPVLSQHDQADTDTSCPVRYVTTVPGQALGMINGQFNNEQAGFLAKRLEKELPGDLPAQVKRALWLTTQREPSEAEVAGDMSYLADLNRRGLSAGEALRQLCLVDLAASEFIYLD